jgi:polyhydroxybutyrate depolymerase
MNKKPIIILLTIVLLIPFFGGCVTTNQSIVFDGRTRYYDIHIPRSYSHQSAMPLVICLHYGGGNGEIFEEVTMFSEKAEKEGFIVVYPYGTGQLEKRLLTWNAGFAAGYALEHQIDDVGFIRTLIEKLQQTLNIDSSRIYLTGFCNGAAMTYRLGAELSDIVAAIAPIAGSIGGKTTEDSLLWVIPEPTVPVPVIVFHGLLDTYVPYHGGLTQGNGSYSVLSVNESISFWIDQNGCYLKPKRNISESGNIIIDTYVNNETNADVVLYTIVNGGHAWPGGNKFFSSDEPTTEISATDVIWEFFKDHPKNEKAIRVEFIDPLQTDPLMSPLNELPDSDERNLHHFISVPTNPSNSGVLYVHLPGSGGLPEDYQILNKHAATLGYHVINLAYPNWPAVRTLIMDESDVDLPEKIRRERLYGENQTILIQVNKNNSIENRIIKLLEYNHFRHPEEHWDQFLTANNGLYWYKIVVGGHSQGAGHAAYLAKQHPLQGIIMFAGPGDYVKDVGSAPWIFQENMISAEQMYAFTHRFDPVSRIFFTHQEILGLDAYGSIQRIDKKSIDELSGHMLSSWLLDIPEKNYHGSVAVDDFLPTNDALSYYYTAWTYMFSNLFEQ